MGKFGRRGEHPHARRIARAQIRTSPNPDARREAREESERVPVSGAKSRSTFSVVTRHWMATPRTPMRSCRRRQVARMGAQYDASAQRPSEVIKRSSRAPRLHEPNQMQSDAISGHQRSSEVIKGSSPARAQCLRERRPLRPETELARDRCRSPPPSLCAPPARIGGNQRPSEASEAIGGHQKPSEAIGGHQRPSEAIRGHQTPGYVG